MTLQASCEECKSMKYIQRELALALGEIIDDLDDGIREELGTGGVSSATLVRARQVLAQAKGIEP